MDETALKLIEKLNMAGFGAYIVGGAVRNMLLKLPIKDYDITTDATPDEIERVFSDMRCIEKGIKHGTVGVVVGGKVYEITTYRTDGNYSDHRRPESVGFVHSLSEDLKRRDFTVNAMALCKDGKIIDNFGGIEDLKKGILRAVGDPVERFTEDALRILRAVRFSSEYGFTIEEKTFDAMLLCRRYLKNVSAERIVSELTLTLGGKYVAQALFSCRQILFEVLPELSVTDGAEQFSLYHDYDVFNHTLAALRYCKCRKPDILWALLFHDVGKPSCLTFDEFGYGHMKGHNEVSYKITGPVLDRLKFPVKLKNDILVLVANHDLLISENKYSVKKFMNKYGKQLTWDMYYVKDADQLAHSVYGQMRHLAEAKYLKYYLDEIEKNNEIYLISDLDISGYDIIKLGVTGQAVGKLKEFLLDEVMQGHIENNNGVLAKAAVDFLKKS